MPPFGRLITAMATPFTDDGRAVDQAQARRLVAALLSSGTEALVVAGTTGEAPTLSTSEKLSLFELALHSAAASGAHVIAGTTSYATEESVELSREAERLGVHGILATVPYYNNPPQEGLYRHFRLIAEAVTVPVILYNVPSRTVRNMEAATTLRLARDVPNIVGVKEASGNLHQIGEILRGAPDGFTVWSGNDADTLPILALGGYGVVSVASHLVGRQLAHMISLFAEGDHAAAALIHHGLTPLVDALFCTTSPIPLKYALNRVGLRVGPTRLPLAEIDAGSQSTVDRALESTQLDVPAPALV